MGVIAGKVWLMRSILGLLICLGLAGCGNRKVEAPTPTPAVPAPAEAVTGHLNRAQPKLPVIKLWLRSEELQVEVARTGTEVATGMMFRTNILDSEGMLFVFSQPHQAGFYMKNTLIPLSCAYIDPDGMILEIHDMTPHDLTPIVAASASIQYVLETGAGWFQRHQVGTGTVVRASNGTLRETFFGARSR
jgi:uncharacterized membrane protein (UPF0127 family)